MTLSDSDIVVSGLGSISPMGCSRAEVEESYNAKRSKLLPQEISGKLNVVAGLESGAEALIFELVREHSEYRKLDRSVQIGILAARQALAESGCADLSDVGVAFGSSRGATGLFENFHRAFLQDQAGRTGVLTSPTTTLGNLASWVAQDLGSDGLANSHSSTCSTGVQTIANACAWLRSDMAKGFLCGGSEAALTAFTLAQFEALGIYCEVKDQELPCRPCLAGSSKNSFALGEGAACVYLESYGTARKRSSKAPLLKIAGLGLSMESLTSATSISHEADAIASAMRRALEQAGSDAPIDALILHAPGTLKGDGAELRAVVNVFGDRIPALTSNKWLIGHTLGASGLLSLEYAYLIISRGTFCRFPYPIELSFEIPSKFNRIMINSAGFGGNAASLIVSRGTA